MVDLSRIAAEFGDDPGDSPQRFEHVGQVWRWTSNATEAQAAWFFLTISNEIADRIKSVAGVRKGFGSVRVEAEIGTTKFKTSLFPSKEMGGFLLPLKVAVRKANGLEEGQEVQVSLILL